MQAKPKWKATREETRLGAICLGFFFFQYLKGVMLLIHARHYIGYYL